MTASGDWNAKIVEEFRANGGSGRIEVGTETVEIGVAEITGDERDRTYAEQAARYPGFAEYEQRTEGVRTIPVLALRRT